MADQQTLDSPIPTQSDDPSSSSTTTATSSVDPSLSRTLSSTRLNADAPEFVPGRTTPPLPQPIMIPLPPPPPPPPPHRFLHMYRHPPPPPPPFHVTIPIPPPPHLIPVRNHGPHPHPLRLPHQQNRRHNQQYAPVRNHGYHGGGGEYEADMTVKKGDHDRRRDYKRDLKKDQAENSIDPKSGLPEDTIQKIVNQVEYYFSDLNLATTDHLMRFISKDPEGYVPIHVVGSFKKIKSVIRSDSQLAIVLQNSSKLAVSEDGKKVRRVDPITDSVIEDLQSRIVIAENLPEDHCYQNLMKIFSIVGCVKNIRTCQPQNSANGPTSSAARSAKTDGTFFSNKIHAFVEYEIVELAKKAVAELDEEGKWRNGLRLRLMLQHKEPKHFEDDATTSEQQPNEKQSKDCTGCDDDHVQEQTVLGEELGGEKVAGGQRKGRTRGRGKGRGRGQNNLNLNQNQNQNLNPNGGVNHDDIGMQPLSNITMNNIEQSSVAKLLQPPPPGPRMPNGTRGFSMGRGKPVTEP